MKQGKMNRLSNLGHAPGETLGSVSLSNHAARTESLRTTPFGARVRREHKRRCKAAKAARREAWRVALKWSKGRGVPIPTPAAVYGGRASL